MNMDHVFACKECGNKYYGKGKEVCSCGGKLEYKGLDFVDTTLSGMTNDLVGWFKKDNKPEVNNFIAEKTKSEVVIEIINKDETSEEKLIDLPVSNLEITNLLGDAKVTNVQMIPAIKLAISEKSKEKLLLLEKEYPEIYQSSLKYVGKRNMKTLEELM